MENNNMEGGTLGEMEQMKERFDTLQMEIIQLKAEIVERQMKLSKLQEESDALESKLNNGEKIAA